MKKIFILSFIICSAFSLTAQNNKPKWLNSVAKAIFTIESTSKEGVKKTGNGFFVTENGEAVSSYEVFINAENAVVITSDGERLQITQILGADDMYGVIRFSVSVTKKTSFLPVAKILPEVNTISYLPPSQENKDLVYGVVSDISKFKSEYNYYRIELALPASQNGFPLLNEAGEVFALSQPDASGKGKTYGVALSYIQSLQATATDMFNKTYTNIGIRKGWSSDISDAQISLLLLASQQDPETFLETLNNFVNMFPNNPEGYHNRASHYVNYRQQLSSTEAEQLKMLDLAWSDLESMEKYSEDKGDAYYNRAELIFGVITNDSTLQNSKWNNKSLEEYLQKAIARQDRPEYRKLEGDIAFNNRNFEKAYNLYSIVNKTPVASGFTFYLAAKSLQQVSGHNPIEVITLLDSATYYSTVNEAEVYILENVELKMQAGLYTQAVGDYNLFYKITGGKVTGEFFYLREQAKFRSNDYEGALTDINIAIEMDESNALYLAEKASVYLRLTEFGKAQESIEKAIEVQPEFASAYRILGICLVRQDKKTEACKQFDKAKELGDPVVERLIKENCN